MVIPDGDSVVVGSMGFVTFDDSVVDESTVGDISVGLLFMHMVFVVGSVSVRK